MARYTNINESPLKEYNAIPKIFKKEIDGVMRQIIGYRGLSETAHHSDGWREIEKPNIDLSTHYYGGLAYDSETDEASYEVINRSEEEVTALLLSRAEQEHQDAFNNYQKRQALESVQGMSNTEALANPSLFPVLTVGLECREGYKYYSVIDGLLECTNNCTVAAVTSNLPNFEKVTV